MEEVRPKSMEVTHLTEEDREEDWANFIIFKVHSDRRPSLFQVRTSLAGRWGITKECITKADDLRYMAKLKSPTNVTRVLEGGPWHVDDDLIAVSRTIPGA